MAGRADFTAEEWTDLGSALISAAELVSFVDGGRSGMAREMSRVRRALSDASKRHPSQLVRELAIEPGRSVIDTHLSPGEAEEPVLRVLRAAAAALSARAPDELEAYRRFVVHLGEVAARATRSGGVFGVGGQRVSYAEASTLDRIRRALGAS
ncbi:MAG TPA: hypothetical protein VFA45_06610 [Actinomycetes bacterium]|jgi:hypothetical protein|nr:hypothetical protein [Actinomycetes bacterium]